MNILLVNLTKMVGDSGGMGRINLFKELLRFYRQKMTDKNREGKDEIDCLMKIKPLQQRKRSCSKS